MTFRSRFRLIAFARLNVENVYEKKNEFELIL